MTGRVLAGLLLAAAVAGACGRPAPAVQATAPATGPEGTAAAPVLVRADERFATLLAELVDPRGLVRYGRLDDAVRRGRLRAVVEGYAEAPLPADRAGRLALWCNAYNANVLLLADTARRRDGFVNVKEVDGFFDGRDIRVAGETLTLNDLENARIRPLDDARIHAALVCAAMSCPPLRDEPFRPATLDAQLDEQCRRWVNDPDKNGTADGRARVSRIFDWYGADFTGPPWNGVAGFLRRYADPDTPLGRLLAANPDPPIGFREYDWSLNLAR